MIPLRTPVAAFEHVVSAYVVAPDPRVKYRVVYPGSHASLKTGDLVVMVETPDHENVLLSPDTFRLHKLTDKDGSYVILVPSEWVETDPPKP